MAALVSSHTQRKTTLKPPPWNASTWFQRLQTVPLSSVDIGWRPIRESLRKKHKLHAKHGRASYLLWGVFHDSGGQLRALNRLLTYEHDAPWTAIISELWASDGLWKGVPRSLQNGASRLLETFAKSGSAKDWEALQKWQRSYNYTAWKYSYLNDVMGGLIRARALRIPFWGCDMPTSLRLQMRWRGKLALRSRELHCWFALQQRLQTQPLLAPQSHRVLVVWGMEHVTAEGFRRWIPRKHQATSVYLVGHRESPFVMASRLAKRVTLFAPVWLPWGKGSQQALLFLPDARFKGSMDRARTPLTSPLAQSELVFLSSIKGQLEWVQDSSQKWVQVRAEKPLRVRVKAGLLKFRFFAQGKLWLGKVLVPKQGRARLTLLTKQRTLRVLLEVLNKGSKRK